MKFDSPKETNMAEYIKNFQLVPITDEPKTYDYLQGYFDGVNAILSLFEKEKK